MKTQSNIHPLRMSSPSRTPATATAPPLLGRMADRFIGELVGWVRSLNDCADDALFELADRSASNQEQNSFFEAMREVRLKRKPMEDSYGQCLHQNLAAWLSAARSADANAGPDSQERLALVDNDELEERVAVDLMCKRAEDQFAPALEHFALRLAQLAPAASSADHPFAPRSVAEAYLSCARLFDIDIKAQLVLLKLFERQVVQRLGVLYAECNQLLVDSGILPDLKGQPVRGRKKEIPVADEPAQMQSAGLHHVNSGDPTSVLLESLHELLLKKRGEETQQQASATAPVTLDDLLRGLGRLEARRPAGMAIAQDSGAQDVLATLQGLVGGEGSGSIASAHQDVIELISLLFKYIVNDRGIGGPARTLFSRLQLPLIRLALQDRSFLSERSHPARRLLDEMASMSVGLYDTAAGGEDQVYRKMQQVVARVQNEFDRDTTIFEDLWTDFERFSQKERRRAEVAEQRLRDAEDGRARSEKAQRLAHEAVQAAVASQTIPAFVDSFLEQHWSRYLFLVALRHGEHSDEWRNASAVVTQLLDSLVPSRTPEQRRELLATLPHLLRSLRHGLQQISADPFQSNRFFTELERTHLRLSELPPIQGVPDTEVAEMARAREVPRHEDVQPPPVPVGESAQPAPSDVVQPAPDSSPQAPVPTAQLQAESAPMVPDLSLDLDVNLDPEADPSAAAAGSLATRGEPTGGPELTSGDRPLFAPTEEPLPSLGVGTWIELQQGDQRLRCKLAAHLSEVDKYIFVNRVGMKVAEYSHGALAEAHAEGRLRVMSDTLMFDRALSAVISDLRAEEDE